jgi:MFS family permease
LTEVVALGNAMRGIAWAGLNTGGYCLLANIAPHTRRGEASGYYGGAQSSATILFPAVSLWLIDASWGGFGPVIMTSSALALVGASVGLVLARSTVKTVPQARPQPGMAQRRLGAASFVDRGVLLASALLLCLNLPHPGVSGFVVLYAQELGIKNLGWYFVASGCVNLLTRPILGRASDRLGHGRSMVAGFVLEILGLGLLLVARNLAVLIIAGIVYALGSSIGTSTTMALAIDRADPQRRGVAMATFSVAFPMGVGVGAVVAGALVEMAGYGGMFLGLAALVAVGLLLAFFNWSTLAPCASEPNTVPR